MGKHAIQYNLQTDQFYTRKKNLLMYYCSLLLLYEKSMVKTSKNVNSVNIHNFKLTTWKKSYCTTNRNYKDIIQINLNKIDGYKKFSRYLILPLKIIN